MRPASESGLNARIEFRHPLSEVGFLHLRYWTRGREKVHQCVRGSRFHRSPDEWLTRTPDRYDDHNEPLLRSLDRYPGPRLGHYIDGSRADRRNEYDARAMNQGHQVPTQQTPDRVSPYRHIQPCPGGSAVLEHYFESDQCQVMGTDRRRVCITVIPYDISVVQDGCGTSVCGRTCGIAGLGSAAGMVEE